MAGVPISGLPSNSTAALTDIVPAVQSGVTYKESFTEIAALLNGSNLSVVANNIPKYNGTTGQLKDSGIALSSIISRVVSSTFTTTGTYTPTAGMLYVIVRAQAGGGSGGGAATTDGSHIACGSGGGGGEFIEALFTAAEIGASKAYVVGAGGVAGTVGNNPGNVGGNTTFNTTWIVTYGGVAGFGCAAQSGVPLITTNVVSGGNGGTVTVGTELSLTEGSYGLAGTAFSVSNGSSGGGGNSGSGNGGGQPIVNNSSANGLTGGAGGGGSGGMTANGTAVAGGAGGFGFITIIEFIAA